MNRLMAISAILLTTLGPNTGFAQAQTLIVDMREVPGQTLQQATDMKGKHLPIGTKFRGYLKRAGVVRGCANIPTISQSDAYDIPLEFKINELGKFTIVTSLAGDRQARQDCLGN